MTKEILNVLNKFPGSSIQKIFDPCQTHAIFGIDKSDKEKAKTMLKEAGASRFRISTNKFGFAIICFKIA